MIFLESTTFCRLGVPSIYFSSPEKLLEYMHEETIVEPGSVNPSMAEEAVREFHELYGSILKEHVRWPPEINQSGMTHVNENLDEDWEDEMAELDEESQEEGQE